MPSHSPDLPEPAGTMSDTSEMTPYKVAVVGAGYFAQFHHEAWQRNPKSELVAVADQDLSRADQSGAKPYTDVEKMLRETAPDIVDIVTPPDAHLEMVEMALCHAPKAVICQKPFCGDLAAARRATALASAKGIPLIVHENFRFQPWYRAMKDAIEDRLIGDILQISFRLRPGDGQGESAYLDRQPYFQEMNKFLIHETGVHWIDTFRYLLGEPVAVYADLRQLNPAIKGEDAGFFLFEYTNGARALFDGNRLIDHPADNHRLTMGECSLEGTTGEIRLLGDGTLHLRRKEEIASELIFTPERTDRFGGDCVYALQESVVAALRGDGLFENLASDYLRVIEMEELIYKSATEGRKLSC